MLVRKEVLPHLSRKISSLVQSRLEPDDILDEAFLRILRNLNLLHPSSDREFYSWVYHVAKNMVIDLSRRHSVCFERFARTGEIKAGVRASQIRARGRRPESVLEKKDTLEDALGKLKETEADIVRQRDLQGKSFEEIAQALGKTAGAVQRCYSRAMERLRELMGQGGR